MPALDQTVVENIPSKRASQSQISPFLGLAVLSSHADIAIFLPQNATAGPGA